MAKESVDKQVTAKDQGTTEEVKPWYTNYKVKSNNAQYMGGYVQSEESNDGSYKYSLTITVDGHQLKTDISEDSAIAIAKSAGISEQETDTGTRIALNSNAVAEIVEQEFGNIVDTKALNFDKNSHKEGAVNTDGDGKKPYTVNALAPATVTDWSTYSSVGRKEGQVVTGANASKKVKANDTGKGGSGNGNGAASTGDGEGANSKVGGSGLGDGTGDGYGTGDGSGDNIESSSNYNNKAQSTKVIDSGKSLDDSTAAASYAASVTNGALNHIFHNNHYQDDPVPAWSFSVDFVPLCMTDKRFIKLYTLEDSKTLTKAVLTVTANEKTINTQSINYLGLQHPFFTKLAQSHGDLKITFAEDELFSISTILKNVLKYASYLPNFPTNKVYEVKGSDSLFSEIVAHNASDSISPKYRLNATDLKITDENTASLVHDYKFVFDILLKIYRPGNAHIFADEAAPPGFVYHFHKCWLKNVGGIELNYDDDKPIDRPAVFSYQYMSGVPYYEWISRNNVLSESQELDKAYDEAAQQAADAAADVVQEAKEYSKNSPSSFTDNGEPASTSLNNLLDDAKNSRLNYLFKNNN